MDHAIACNHVEKNDECAAGTGGDLYELVPRGGDVLPACAGEAGGARRDILALHGGARHHVSQQHRL